jgi:outer membrane protein assembly factor BamB
MLAGLRADVDRVPSGSAADARRRGTRRTRVQWVAGVALAAGLASAAVAVAGIVPPARDNLPASGGLSPVGRALTLDDHIETANSAIDGDGVFTAWRTRKGDLGVLGADLGTGRERWRTALGRFEYLRGVIALPRAVLVVGSRDGAGATATILDPVNGERRWETPYRVTDDLIYYDDLLVRQEQATGDTSAYDWATGDLRWQVRAPADRPDRTLGMLMPQDATRIGRLGLPMTFTDRRLIQIARSGEVRIRDAGTGKLQQTRTAAPTGFFRPTAFDGDLYSADRPAGGSSAYRLRVTALRGSAQSRVVHTGSRLNGFAPCGTGRLCVSDSDKAGKTTLTAVNVQSGRAAWRVPAPAGAASILSLGEGIVVAGADEQVLYAADGTRLAAAPDRLGRLGDRDVLVLPGATGRPIVRVSAVTGEQRALGPMPPGGLGCTWAAERLACADGSALRIWSLPR